MGRFRQVSAINLLRDSKVWEFGWELDGSTATTSYSLITGTGEAQDATRACVMLACYGAQYAYKLAGGWEGPRELGYPYIP